MSTTDDMINEINSQLDDINTAKMAATEKGKRSGDYDLATLAGAVRRDRLVREDAEAKHQADVMNSTNLNIVEDEPIAPITNVSQENYDFGRGLDSKGFERTVRNPYQQNLWVDSNRGDMVGAKIFKFEPGMMKDSPHLREAVKANPKARMTYVVQVTDKKNLSNGKPTQWIEPYYEKSAIKDGEPKREDFGGELYQDRAFQRAMAEYYGKDYENIRLKK